jgi:hypothetical protein
MGFPIADENDLPFTSPTDLRQGFLLRRKYDRASGSSVVPTTSALFTSQIAAGTFQVATFSASISGTTMTVYSVSSGTIKAGMTLINNTQLPTGSNAPIIIGSLGTSGGHPIYQISASLTVSTSTIGGIYERIVSAFTPEVEDDYYYEFFGFFKVDYGEGGNYQFQLSSDDCSEVFINGQLICQEYTTGLGSSVSGSVTLPEGYHRIVVRFFEANGLGGNQSLTIQYKKPNSGSFESLPTTRLYFDPAELFSLSASQRVYSSLSISKSVSLSRDAVMGETFAGKWEDAKNYRTGDFVYIENSNIKVSKRDVNDSTNWEPLQKFYFCTKNHTSSGAKHPSFNKENWIGDQCSKTINGCKLRFGESSHLPFGGFPGTEEFAISAQ